MEEKEQRVRAITKLYYSNPKIQEILLKFSADREVVPRYFEGFGKRPDMLQYPSDIMGLVNKGATSFHCSEEIWLDPLKISSDMTPEQLKDIRKSWDLLIDIDSPYLDYSKIALKLILDVLEEHGVMNYGLKFSGSKGFHIIISGKAFPEEYDGMKMKDMFPEWPRAIVGYLINTIRPKYNRAIGQQNINFEAVKQRTNLTQEDLTEVTCPNCNRPSKKGEIVTVICPICKMTIERKDAKITKRKLKCLNEKCAGVLEIADRKDYSYCEYCKISTVNKLERQGGGSIVYSSEAKKDVSYSDGFEEGISGNALGELDLILVAPRHLFRMPYSLHEKTSLASAVITKEQIENFSPKDASPMKIKIIEYMPNSSPGEAKQLLAAALDWKENQVSEEEKIEKKNYEKYQNYNKTEITGASENMFPKPIKKLLKGLKEGKKRGLFILITFLRSLNFSPEFINARIREWNKLNEPPLREGYVKGQIDWHLKQKKQILPPNYDNTSFYKDLGLLDEKPKVKNPIVEVIRILRNRDFREGK